MCLLDMQISVSDDVHLIHGIHVASSLIFITGP